MHKKKNPHVAAVLAAVLGPLGFFYIGWRYGIMAVILSVVYAITVSIIFLNFDSPDWMKYIVMLVFISKAYTITTTRNQNIQHGDHEEKQVLKLIDSFTGATMAMTDMFVGLGIYYAIAICLYVSVVMLINGHILKGVLMLFLGTPTFLYLTQLAFGFIALVVDAITAKGIKNIYSSNLLDEYRNILPPDSKFNQLTP